MSTTAGGEFGNPLRKFKLVFLGEQSGEYRGSRVRGQSLQKRASVTDSGTLMKRERQRESGACVEESDIGERVGVSGPVYKK